MSDLLNAACKSSGLLLAGQDATSGPATVFIFTVIPAAADAIALYRDGGAGGPILWELKGAANGPSVNVTFPNGLRFSSKVYADLAGAGMGTCVGYV